MTAEASGFQCSNSQQNLSYFLGIWYMVEFFSDEYCHEGKNSKVIECASRELACNERIAGILFLFKLF
jgi:hypothetical protein